MSGGEYWIPIAVATTAVVGGFAAKSMLTRTPHGKAPKPEDRCLGFTNIPREVLVEEELTVTGGEIPTWINGKLFRNGPGKFDLKENNGTTYTINHWFDALGVLHRFKIENGKVYYKSKSFCPEIEEFVGYYGTLPFSFGLDPCKTGYSKFQSLWRQIRGKKEIPGNVNVTIKQIGDKFFNQTDANQLREFNPETLEVSHSTSYAQFNPALNGPSSAAHGYFDHKTNEYINFTVQVGRKPFYRFFSYNNTTKETTILAEIPAPHVYLHSFAVTDKYVIFQWYPALLSVVGLLWSKHISPGLKFDQTKNSKFFVIDRKQKKVVATYETQAMFCFHNVNAWDDGDNVVMDLCTYPNIDLINWLELQNIAPKTVSPPTPNQIATTLRFTLRDVSKAEATTPLKAEFISFGSSTGAELPRINPLYARQPTRFFYAACTDAAFLDKLIKIDTKLDKAYTWHSEGCRPAEPIFLNAPNGTDEDEGVLLSIVLDENKKTSFLLLLNAKDMTEIARAYAKVHVPFGFHGNFYGSQLSTDIA